MAHSRSDDARETAGRCSSGSQRPPHSRPQSSKQDVERLQKQKGCKSTEAKSGGVTPRANAIAPDATPLPDGRKRRPAQFTTISGAQIPKLSFKCICQREGAIGRRSGRLCNVDCSSSPQATLHVHRVGVSHCDLRFPVGGADPDRHIPQHQYSCCQCRLDLFRAAAARHVRPGDLLLRAPIDLASQRHRTCRVRSR